MAIDRFSLPRDDWYDDQGRIYKDALIENFNALEEKLLELQRLDVFDVQEVDWSTVSINDTTLASSDASVVNARSLANIIGFNDNMPVLIEVSGKVIKYMEWYHNGVKQHIYNRTLSIVDDQYVWFNPTNGNTAIIDGATVISNIDNNVEGFVLGGMTGGSLYLSSIPRMIDYDVLGALSNMRITPVPFTDGLGGGAGMFNRDRIAGRRLGVTDIGKRGGSMHWLTLPDTGFEADGTR